jgi:hypothetical protein
MLNWEQVSELFQAGVSGSVYVFEWQLVHPNGLAVSEDLLLEAEKTEATNTFRTSQNPTLLYEENSSGRLRKIKASDIFYDESGASIIRLVMSPCVTDVALIEKYIHIAIRADPVGYRLHIKEGGCDTSKQKWGGIYGVSILVLRNRLDDMNLVVREDFRKSYEADLEKHGGREGLVKLPLPPPMSFELPPRHPASGAFVLGGPFFEFKRGMRTAENAIT